jgi:hypothetical protein
VGHVIAAGVALRREISFRSAALQISQGVRLVVARPVRVVGLCLPGGSVSYLYYADRLNQLPLGVVGIAVGTAILPSLSRQVRLAQRTDAVATQNRGIELALLLTLPAAVALALLATPILTVLFQRGAFGPADTAATAADEPFKLVCRGIRPLDPCWLRRAGTATAGTFPARRRRGHTRHVAFGANGAV